MKRMRRRLRTGMFVVIRRRTVNGDGFDDIWIGAIYNNQSHWKAGCAYVVRGKKTGWAMDTSLCDADYIFTGEDSYNYAGAAIACVRDVNGDGATGDFVIGTPTPTPAPRDHGPLITYRENGTVKFGVGSRGDIAANSVSESASFPGSTAGMPWVIYEDNGGTKKGMWVESDGDFLMSSAEINALSDLPASGDRLFVLRGDTGRIVSAGTDLGDVYLRDTYNLPDAPSGTDVDSDSLTNLAEIIDHGTDPSLDDTDADAQKDNVEISGVTVNGVHLPFPTWGSDPLHRDIWMEADWMGTPSPQLNPTVPPMDPKPTALAMLRDMFADAPVENPDGLDGITLHIDAGSSKSLNFNGTGSGDAAYGGGTVVDFEEELESNELEHLKDPLARKKYFFHALFAYKHPQAAVGGKSTAGILITQRGEADNFLNQARVTAHELGHSLGLDHNGDSGTPSRAMNYNSVMNTGLFSTGLDLDCDGLPNNTGAIKIDFSHGDRLSLDQTALLESQGVCGCEERGVDFNMNGCIETTVLPPLLISPGHVFQPSGNGPKNHAPLITIMEDHDDWGNINYRPGSGKAATCIFPGFPSE